MCAMFIIHVAFASVKMAFDSVPLALFSRASGLIGTEYTFSIIETAKENDLDPYEYLKYVFTKAPNMENSESIDILLPWNAPDCCRSKSTHSTE